MFFVLLYIYIKPLWRFYLYTKYFPFFFLFSFFTFFFVVHKKFSIFWVVFPLCFSSYLSFQSPSLKMFYVVLCRVSGWAPVCFLACLFYLCFFSHQKTFIYYVFSFKHFSLRFILYSSTDYIYIVRILFLRGLDM